MRTSRIVTSSVAVLFLSGCAGIFAADPPADDSRATPTPTVAPTPSVAPLTGEPVEAAIATPALAVKIDNQVDARPQTGLETADIVFEELVEGGITRYVAVWNSTLPDEVGPVRSIRPMDPAIIAPFGGAVVYSGGQDRFIAAMQETDVVNVVHGESFDDYFARDESRLAPHNVYVDLAALEAEGLPVLDPPATQWEFSAIPSAASGEPASSVTTVFSEDQVSSWTCSADGAWLRSQQGEPDLSSTGEQLQAANVLVLRVAVEDDLDVPATQLENVSGTGVLQSGCMSIPVTWSKGDVDEQFVIQAAGGEAATFAEGATWVELVPESGSVSVS